MDELLATFGNLEIHQIAEQHPVETVAGAVWGAVLADLEHRVGVRGERRDHRAGFLVEVREAVGESELLGHLF